MTAVAKSPAVTPNAVMKRSGLVLWLGALVVALTVAATPSGLLASGGGGESAFTTVRGTTAEIYGRGLYEHDTVFSGAGQRGTDIITLALGVPFLVACLVFYRGGSLRAGLLLVGGFSYILCVYSSLASSQRGLSARRMGGAWP